MIEEPEFTSGEKVDVEKLADEVCRNWNYLSTSPGALARFILARVEKRVAELEKGISDLLGKNEFLKDSNDELSRDNVLLKSDLERAHINCPIHGQLCLTCGEAARLEVDLLLKQRDQSQAREAGLREALNTIASWGLTDCECFVVASKALADDQGAG